MHLFNNRNSIFPAFVLRHFQENTTIGKIFQFREFIKLTKLGRLYQGVLCTHIHTRAPQSLRSPWLPQPGLVNAAFHSMSASSEAAQHCHCFPLGCTISTSANHETSPSLNYREPLQPRGITPHDEPTAMTCHPFPTGSSIFSHQFFTAQTKALKVVCIVLSFWSGKGLGSPILHIYNTFFLMTSISQGLILSFFK